MGHWSYLLQRLLHAVMVVWGVTLITFIVARLLPGNPVHLIVGSHADPETVREATERLGLDLPIWQQYVRYLSDLLRGDLGQAWTTSNPVTVDIVQRLPATLELSLIGLLLALLMALPLGTLAALRPGGIVDRLTQFVAITGVAAPQFWLGLMLIYVFFYRLGWFPPPLGRLPSFQAPPAATGFMLVDTLLVGDFTAFAMAAKALVLPGFTLAFTIQVPILRVVQTTMQQALASDAVRTARALGLPSLDVVYRYALRLSLVPVLTMVGMTFGNLLGGTVLVESVFSWPGIGQYAVQALNSMDYAAIQGVVLVGALVYIGVYFILDVLSALIDPRITFEGGRS